MREAITIFRKAGAPVLFSYHSVIGKGIVEGSKDFDLLPAITAREEERKVIKTHLNAFNGTGLDTLLKEKGCDTVMIIGLSAVHCVLATYFGA